jgi:DNA primase catalytic core
MASHIARPTGVNPYRLVEANTSAAAYFRDHLVGHLPALLYLHSRGAVAATVHTQPWGIGYAPPGWTSLHTHLSQLGFTGDEQLAAGLVATSSHGSLIDVFHDRVMFPIRSRDGQIVAFIGRFIGRDPPGHPPTPKYRNTTTTIIYSKKHQLYGLAEQFGADQPPDAVMLVEGPTDVLAIARIRRTVSIKRHPSRWYAVAPCGTVLTAEQVALLAGSLPPGTPIIVASDADAAGLAATDRSRRLLYQWNGPIEAIALPTGQDPASLVAAHGARGASQILDRARQPLVDLVVNHRLAAIDATHIEGRVRALRSVAPLIADTAARDTAHAARIAGYLSARLNLTPLTVYEAIYPPDDQQMQADPARADSPGSAALRARGRQCIADRVPATGSASRRPRSMWS